MGEGGELTAERRYEVACESAGSRPPALLTWHKGKRQLKRITVSTQCSFNCKNILNQANELPQRFITAILVLSTFFLLILPHILWNYYKPTQILSCQNDNDLSNEQCLLGNQRSSLFSITRSCKSDAGTARMCSLH